MKILKKLWAPMLWIIIWQACAMLISENLILVSPVSVVKRLIELLPESGFWQSVLNTTGRILAGYIIGLLFGTLLAVISARFKLFREFLAPFMTTVKAIPVASFTILALFLISAKNLSVLVTVLISLPIVYSNILTGIDSADKKLLEMAKVFRISSLKKTVYIYFSQILPYFCNAASVSAGLSWKSGVAAEVIVISAASVGELLYQSKITLEMSDLFALTLVVILLSRLTEFVFQRLIRGAWKLVEKI